VQQREKALSSETEDLVEVEGKALAGAAEHCVHGIAQCSFESVAPRLAVVLHVANGRFDGASALDHRLEMTMQVINAVAEFERDLLIERTNSGIKRARAEGTRFGRPPALTDAQRSEVLGLLAQGVSVAQIARQFDTTRQTIMRIRAT